MTEQKIGDRIDGAGVVLDLEDDDLVSDYLVIAKVHRSDGDVTIAMGIGDGMDWITQLGLVTAATEIITGGGYAQEDK